MKVNHWGERVFEDGEAVVVQDWTTRRYYPVTIRRSYSGGAAVDGLPKEARVSDFFLWGFIFTPEEAKLLYALRPGDL